MQSDLNLTFNISYDWSPELIIIIIKCAPTCVRKWPMACHMLPTRARIFGRRRQIPQNVLALN